MVLHRPVECTSGFSLVCDFYRLRIEVKLALDDHILVQAKLLLQSLIHHLDVRS
jgi:hypothetical protein